MVAKAKPIRVWQHIRCPDFVRYVNGALSEIMCKLCGTVIAGTTTSVESKGLDRNGVMVETRVKHFQRFHNYAEIKILFTNGTAHVTNGCSACISESMAPDILQEMYEADIVRDPTGYTDKDKKREAENVTAVARNAGGLQ